VKLKNLGLTAAIIAISQTAFLFQETKILAEAGSNRLDNGESLRSNEYIISSNGLYQLYLQGDGNLVASRISDGVVYWSSGTGGSFANRLVMQGDNHLALYQDNRHVWTASNTWGGEPGAFLKIEDNGKIAVYKFTPVWSTPTAPIVPTPPDPQPCLYRYEGLRPIPCDYPQ
jgi:hypothetical protein